MSKNQLQNVLNEVLEKIKPTKEDEKKLFSEVDRFINNLQSKLKKARVILGGSGAKGTWLKDTFDIDIFVRFDKDKYKDENISDILEKALKDFKPVRLHGSRDYFQIMLKDLIYEIVPVIDIDDAKQSLNITDVSPLHAKWVEENATEKIKDEIRLLKQFFKANNLYGAESYIKGFSGYVIEILTIHYGCLEKFFKESKKYKGTPVIDISKFHKDVFFEVNSSKLISPMIVIDPVQPGRNAAAALSYEKYEKFRKLADVFLKEPSIQYFEKKELDINNLKKGYLVIKVKPKEGKTDIVGAKLEKAFNYIANKLEKNDFVIGKKDWQWKDDAIFYYELKDFELSETKKIVGPPKHLKDHVKSFKKKYSDTLEEDDRIVAIIKRKIRTPKDLTEEFKKDKYIKEKVKSLVVL